MDLPSNSDTEISRRRALAAGAGMAASAGLVGMAASSLASSGGKCVFVYDDSPVEDYTKTFPAHESKGAPACLGVVPGYLGSTDRLTVDQLLEISGSGWEVLSHTMHHQPIGWVPITSDVPQGETAVPVTFTVHGKFEGSPARLLDNTGTAFTETISGRFVGTDAQYVFLENGTDAALDSSATARFRFTSAYVDEALSQSKSYLQDLGLTAESVVAPYQIYDQFAVDRARESYAACANGALRNGINYDIDPYRLDRGTMTGPSLSTIRSRARDVAANDGLYLLGSHSWDADLTQERIAVIIDIVREEGLEITTLHDVLVDAGVVSGGGTGSGSRHELVVEGTGPTVQFHAAVTDEIWGKAGTLEDSDSVGGATVDGQVSTLDDTYYYYGSLTSFDITQGTPEEVNVYVDGDPFRIADFHSLTVQGSGPVTEFSFSVSDEILGAPETWEDTDTVGASSVDGQVSTLDDTYTYYGSLESFDVTRGDPSDITLLVDGVERPVGAATDIHELVVRGSGPVTEFTFSVSGGITGDSSTWESTDSVGTSHVDGQVSTLDDTYTFTGDLERFTVTDGEPEDITVFLDGVEQSVGDSNEHVMTVEGSGPVTKFEFSVSGEITGDSSTWESTDSVGTSTVAGQVSILDDTYTFTGDLEQFTVTEGSADDITVVVDGTERTMSGDTDKTLVVEGSGPVTNFSFSVSGEVTGDSSTWESTDSVGASTVDGQVSTLDDTYTYTGDLEQFTVTEGNAEDIRVLVDGNERAVSGPTGHAMTVSGTGPTIQFTFTVSGEITGDAGTWESTDSVGTSTVDGQVSTLDDTYRYTGDLQSFEVTDGSTSDIEVYVDGAKRSV